MRPIRETAEKQPLSNRRIDKTMKGKEVHAFKGKNSSGKTGLEPATSGVTGQYSNQLSYFPSSKELAHV